MNGQNNGPTKINKGVIEIASIWDPFFWHTERRCWRVLKLEPRKPAGGLRITQHLKQQLDEFACAVAVGDRLGPLEILHRGADVATWPHSPLCQRAAAPSDIASRACALSRIGRCRCRLLANGVLAARRKLEGLQASSRKRFIA